MTCPSCDDARYLPVTEATAERMVGPLVIPPDADPGLAERLTRDYDVRLAAARNTVYPCRDCNPGAFTRWLAGAYASTLATNGRAPRPLSVADAVPRGTPPDRKDLDL